MKSITIVLPVFDLICRRVLLEVRFHNRSICVGVAISFYVLPTGGWI